MKDNVLRLKPRLALILKKGDKIMATAPISKYPNGRPATKVIKTKRISQEALQKLITLGYTVAIV